MDFKKFAAAKAAMSNPVKNTEGYGYKYATLDQVMGIVDPACEDHGVCYIQSQSSGTLNTVVFDVESGEVFVTDVRPLGDGTDQQRGSSETYQRRYALLTVFGLAPEDDDGKAASEARRAPRKAAEPKQAPDPLASAKGRLWAAVQAYADRSGGDAQKIAEGVHKRADYAETAEFYEAVALEFETS